MQTSAITFSNEDHELLARHSEREAVAAFYNLVRGSHVRAARATPLFLLGKKIVAFRDECRRTYDSTDCSRAERLAGG